MIPFTYFYTDNLMRKGSGILDGSGVYQKNGKGVFAHVEMCLAVTQVFGSSP